MIIQALGKILISIAVVLFGIGGLLLLLSKFGLQRLPGDIVFKRSNFTFFFPIVTSIVLSLLLTLVFYIVNKFR